MKIINNISQNSEEWLRLRLGIPTASEFSKIITSEGKLSTQLRAYALKLASEKLLIELEDTYTNAAMQRGSDLEPEARQAYEEYTFNTVEQVAIILHDNCGYSPDGLVGEDGSVEFKSPLAPNHVKYMYEDRLPVEYKSQCQGGLYVSGRKWIDFCSYHPGFSEDKKLFIKRVYRDEEFISKLKEGIDKVICIRDEYLSKIN